MKWSMNLVAFLTFGTASFAVPLLSEDNINTLTQTLSDEGYTITEIGINGENYEVLGELDGQDVVVLVNEDYQIVDVHDAN